MNNWVTGWSFLHLNGGFWFIGLPIILIWISGEWYSKIKEEGLNALEDFGEFEDIEEPVLYTMEFKVNKEEKWKIGQVLKRAQYNTIDELVRNSLYEMIK